MAKPRRDDWGKDEWSRGELRAAYLATQECNEDIGSLLSGLAEAQAGHRALHEAIYMNGSPAVKRAALAWAGQLPEDQARSIDTLPPLTVLTGVMSQLRWLLHLRWGDISRRLGRIKVGRPRAIVPPEPPHAKAPTRRGRKSEHGLDPNGARAYVESVRATGDARPQTTILAEYVERHGDARARRQAKRTARSLAQSLRRGGG